MSGEFLKKARALGGFDPEVRINFSRELQVQCWREVLDVIEAATIYNERLGVVVLDDDEKIVSLENRLLALDEKARKL